MPFSARELDLSSAFAARGSGGRGQAARALASLEERSGGRRGVAALDTGSGRQLGHRADERFPMCSTAKLVTGAAILARIDRGDLTLDRRIAYTAADLLEYARSLGSMSQPDS